MVEKGAVKTSARGSLPPSRKVGLDKPCTMCGSAIYFNYEGPLEGICGNCTDKLRRQLGPRGRSGGTVVQRTRVTGFGWGSLLLAFLAGAAAATIALLLGWIPV